MRWQTTSGALWIWRTCPGKAVVKAHNRQLFAGSPLIVSALPRSTLALPAQPIGATIVTLRLRLSALVSISVHHCWQLALATAPRHRTHTIRDWHAGLVKLVGGAQKSFASSLHDLVSSWLPALSLSTDRQHHEISPSADNAERGPRR